MATKDLTVGALRRAFTLNGLPLSRDEALLVLGVSGAPDAVSLREIDVAALARRWACDWSGERVGAAEVLRDLLREG